MLWLSQGPWGGGPRGGGPWGGGPRDPGGPGGGPGPGRRGPRPPDFEELLRRSQNQFRRILPGGFGVGAGIGIAVLAVVVIWLASGFYRVQPDEVGIVLRFGAYNRTTQPGLNYHLPAPIETALTPKVTRVNRTEIGYRSSENAEGQPGESEQVPEESLMLTGDENIVDVNCTVFWVIDDAKAYLFNIRAPDKTVQAAAESALTEVIAEHPLAMELSAGRAQIENDTQKLLQQLLDFYHAGVSVTQVTLQRVDPPGPVIAAFRDVQAALADKARLRNVAEAYANNVVPNARGDAAKIVQAAQAYRQKVVAQSEGDAARFDAVYRAFKAAQDVTAERLYLETIEEVLKNSNKVIIDKGAQGAGGVVPYLPLPGLGGGKPATTSVAPGVATANGPAASTSDTPLSPAPSEPGQQ
jgi:modulator of FtsH protease HflK